MSIAEAVKTEAKAVENTAVENKTIKSKETALQVSNLNVVLRHEPDTQILKDVSFQLNKGEVFALVGESGSGKSMTSLSIMRLLPDALKITRGNIQLNHTNLFALTEQEMGAVRGKRLP